MTLLLPSLRLRIATAAALALPLALAGCASGGVGSAAPAPSSSGAHGRTVTVGDNAARTTVTLAPGDTLEVVLHSTYWSAPVSSGPAMLSPLGQPTAAPVSTGPGCGAPGSGCGTVTTDFRAVADGTVRIDSTRSSCGEAKPCLPQQRGFEVTVVVKAP